MSLRALLAAAAAALLLSTGRADDSVGARDFVAAAERARLAKDPREVIVLAGAAISGWRPANGQVNLANLYCLRGDAYARAGEYGKAFRDLDRGAGIRATYHCEAARAPWKGDLERVYRGAKEMAAAYHSRDGAARARLKARWWNAPPVSPSGGDRENGGCEAGPCAGSAPPSTSARQMLAEIDPAARDAYAAGEKKP